MPDTEGTLLSGLSGDNPLGFLAALGVQAALAARIEKITLRWTNDAIPHPIIAPALNVEFIANVVRRVAEDWLDGPVFARGVDQTLKMEDDDTRRYLQDARYAGRQGVLAACLVAEGSRYTSGKPAGKSKPTDFYFTAARQQFLAMARSRLESTGTEAIGADISDTWQYKCTDNNSLMWDLRADRHHAYSAADPNDHRMNPKGTNAGAETLAIIGLSCFPCFSDLGEIKTRGFSRDGRFKYFTWPLWTIPATSRMVTSLLGHVKSPSQDTEGRNLAYPAWGIVRVLQSQLRSRGQGFGTFGPPRVVWQRD